MNNATSASFDETVELIENMPNEEAILLCGDHGIGKSACVFRAGQVLKKRMPDYVVNDVRLAGKEPGDIIGLFTFKEVPLLDSNGNQIYDNFGKPIINTISVHCPPAWWAPYFNPECRGILFLDEINRAHRDVRQGLFQLILDRELNGNKLPRGVKIVAAINDSEDYDTETLDLAFRSRWRIINFTPTQKEWLENLDLHPLVFGFISDHKTSLETSKKEPDTVSPDRRSWYKLSKALKKLDEDGVELKDSTFKKLAATFIGNEVATAFEIFRKQQTVVTGEKILSDFKHYVRYVNFREVGQLSKIGSEIVDIIKESKGTFSDNKNKKKMDNLVSFMIRLPLENARVLYDEIARADLKVLKAFMQYQKSNPEFSNIMKKSIGKIEITG